MSPNVWCKHFVHEGYKGRRGISHAKVHYETFVGAVLGPKGILRNIFSDSNLIISGSQVNLKEDLHSTKLV